jgi:hypothetical protein
MFILTRQKDSIESGTYATKDTDGTTVVQFFVDKDDAVCYNEQLRAVDYDLEITEIPDEAIDKMCEAMGYAYTVVEPGEVIFPRLENLEKFIDDL